jgi:hypothetical protein
MLANLESIRIGFLQQSDFSNFTSSTTEQHTGTGRHLVFHELPNGFDKKLVAPPSKQILHGSDVTIPSVLSLDYIPSLWSLPSEPVVSSRCRELMPLHSDVFSSWCRWKRCMSRHSSPTLSLLFTSA